MNNQVAEVQNNTTLVLSEDELVDVLQSSLYPGAAMKSIKMVISYCKAANLDPMQKPVHIVPMWDKNAKAMRDVIMPGVGLYRTQAARSNALAGISEPEFGPVIEHQFDSAKFSAPEWCRVVVRRLLGNGTIGDFAAVEYWIENYATAGKDSLQPNAMWKKRPRGQLAKCAQAQALRMAFPEMTGSAPTADEMEGKAIDAEREIDITPKIEHKKEIEACSDDKFESNKSAWRKLVESGKKTVGDLIATLNTKAVLTDAQIKEIKSWSMASTTNNEFTDALDASGDYVPE